MENVVPGHLQRLRAADIIRMAGLAAASVGQEYYRAGAVHSVSRRGALLIGIVELAPRTGTVGVEPGASEPGASEPGASPAPTTVPVPPDHANANISSQMGSRRFPVEVEFVGTGLAPSATPTVPAWRSKCTCSSNAQGQGAEGAGVVPAQTLLCAHGAALLYQWLAQPALFQTQEVSPGIGKGPVGGEQGQGQSLRGSGVGEIRGKPYEALVWDKASSGSRKDIDSPCLPGGKVYTPNPHESSGNALGAAGVKSIAKNEKNDVTTGERKEAGVVEASLAPAENLQTLFSQSSLSDLRAVAREYGLVVSGMPRQQLAESLQTEMQKPDAVRRIAATLEKSQRQLLAALILAGGAMSDDDLRGLFDRFSLGQPSQLQNILLALQSKALLFRTSLNTSNMPLRSNHGLLSSALLDIGWYVPLEVRHALRVSVPVTPFDMTKVDEEDAPAGQRRNILRYAEPSGPLPLLLLVARLLDGYSPGAHETWYGGSEQSLEVDRGRKDGPLRPSNASNTPASGLPSADGSVAMPSPEDLPPPSFLQELQERIFPREQAGSGQGQAQSLRFIVRVLGVADLLQKGDRQSPALCLRSGVAERLLGADWAEMLRTLFKLWLTEASYGDLYDLTDERVRLRCRAHVGQGMQHQPVLRSSELEAEHSYARQYIVALLAQAPLNQWMNFSSFARFVYRLNPLFLQRRQMGGRAMTGFAAPQWWLEVEEGRPLRPLQLNDWLRAEFIYLKRMIAGPLHWWGACDIVTSADGNLLAFRLTPIAGWLFNGVEAGQGQGQSVQLEGEDDYGQYVAALDVTDADLGQVQGQKDESQALPLLLVSCSVQNWPVIQLLEMFTEGAGVAQLQYPQTDRRYGEDPLPPSVPPNGGDYNGMTPTYQELLLHNLALAYRISAKAFGLALGRGLRPLVLLRLLRLAAEVKADPDTRKAQLFTRIATQFEQWLAGYSRVRLYTGVTLLETVDVAVMREVVATTSLDESIVQNIHSTLCIVKPHTIGHIVEELKQRGQSPLLHDEDL